MTYGTVGSSRGGRSRRPRLSRRVSDRQFYRATTCTSRSCVNGYSGDPFAVQPSRTEQLSKLDRRGIVLRRAAVDTSKHRVTPTTSALRGDPANGPASRTRALPEIDASRKRRVSMAETRGILTRDARAHSTRASAVAARDTTRHLPRHQGAVLLTAPVVSGPFASELTPARGRSNPCTRLEAIPPRSKGTRHAHAGAQRRL